MSFENHQVVHQLKNERLRIHSLFECRGILVYQDGLLAGNPCQEFGSVRPFAFFDHQTIATGAGGEVDPCTRVASVVNQIVNQTRMPTH
jgi:hypothetical protein